MTQLVVCLCCGERYPESRDCGNVERVEHSVERATEVAKWLLWNGIDDPTSSQVKSVLAILALHERA